jgi:hypothetical protein
MWNRFNRFVLSVWLFYILIQLLIDQEEYTEEIELGEQRRRLAFFDPKTVEFKEESLIPKPLQATTATAVTSVSPTPAMPSLNIKDPPNTPSYIALCHEIILRTDPDTPEGKRANQPFIVTESLETCQSEDSFTALTTILLSAAIAQAGSMVRLIYLHNCSQPNSTSSTIQQWLPHHLTFAVGIGQSNMKEACQKCLSSSHMKQCLGMPEAGIMHETLDPMTTSFRIAGFRHNIQQALQDYGTALLRKASVDDISNGGSVVLLDLDNETSGRAWAMPTFNYHEILPLNPSSIAVLATKRCVDQVSTCDHHRKQLSHDFTQKYPNSAIHSQILSSTADVYFHIMNAPQLICPSSITCILPALFRDYSKSSIHLMNGNLFEWFNYVARENRKLMGKQIVILSPQNVTIRPLTANPSELDATLNIRPSRRLIWDPKTVVAKHGSGETNRNERLN